MTNIAIAFDRGDSSAASPGKLERLMRRAANDDAIAFEALFYELKPVVAAFIAKRVDSRSSAEDMSQETLSRLWQIRKKYNQTSSVTTFALGIAMNVIREDRAASSRKADVLPDSDLEQQVECDVVDAAQSVETREILAHAKGRLSEHAAAAIELAYEQQLRPAECARFLGCTEKAFRRRLEKARKKLGKMLHSRIVSLLD